MIHLPHLYAVQCTGNFLAPFKTFKEWQLFYTNGKKNKAVNNFCHHGGRLNHWMPYDRIKREGVFHVNYYKSEQPIALSNQWSSKYSNTSKDGSLCIASSLGSSTLSFILTGLLYFV